MIPGQVLTPDQYRNLVERNRTHLLVHGWRFVFSRRRNALCLWNDNAEHGYSMSMGPSASDPLGQRADQMFSIGPPTDFSDDPVLPSDVPPRFMQILSEMFPLL